LPVKEVIKNVKSNTGSAKWATISTEEHTYGYIHRQNDVNVGDTISFDFSVTGNPTDFFIWFYPINGTSHELVRWTNISGSWVHTWVVPEKGDYTFNFATNGVPSQVHGTVYREYVKHFP
jgi:hypothetical protein